MDELFYNMLLINENVRQKPDKYLSNPTEKVGESSSSCIVLSADCSAVIYFLRFHLQIASDGVLFSEHLRQHFRRLPYIVG